MRFSVLQWNVLYSEKIDNILALVQQINPDIFCAQELTQQSQTNPDIDCAEKIQQLKYQGYYRATIDKPGFTMGNAIFTKFLQSNQLTEPVQLSDGSGDYDKETRLYLETTCAINGSDVTIGTIHLSYTSAFTETALRNAENEKFLPIVRRHSKNFIFCGDFNATPDSALISELSNTFTAASPPLSEKTWTTKPFEYNGFSANTLDWRLDYMFCTHDMKVVSTEVVKTEFSDHLPILTVFEI